MNRRNFQSQHVVCVWNEGCRASLVVRRIYKVVPDPEAAKRRLLRVVDESGEDYLYPRKLFVAIEVPKVALGMFSLAT